MNKRLLLSILIFILLPGFPATAADKNGARKVEEIIESIKSPGGNSGARLYSITGDEFNAWLRSKTAEQAFINSISAGFHDQNHADLELVMDISKMESDNYYPKMIATMFKGSQTLKVEGEIKINAGNFSFTVNSLTINDTIVTPGLVAPLIAALLPEYNLAEPMPLPYGITDIRTSEGLLTIVTDSIMQDSREQPSP